ncbi:MAG: class I SAM-dependent methyltransferase [Fidelibacterota bacterium]
MIQQDFSFSGFAQQKFYRILNARLIDMLELGSGQRIVDLACGTGAILKLILERLRNARESVVIGIDQSSSALQQAAKDLASAKNAALEFVQSRVERLSRVVKGSVDTIVFCNGIHYIKDKGGLIREIRSVLRPGGIFAFNTSFFEGGQVPDSLRFYRRWMLKALKHLKYTYGLVPRKEDKVEARRQLSPDQYERLLEEGGLEVTRKEVHTVDMPLEGWLTISQYEDFIAGVMPGVPLEKASNSLKSAVKQTFEELNLNVVPRNWLYMVALRNQ